MSSEGIETVSEYTKVESIFVRHRNCLLLKADFSPVFTDYYVHLMEQKLRYKEDLDNNLKDLLAALTLHLVARPWAETIAWTANIRTPRVNYFATGSSVRENIVGAVFTENVKETDRNLLFSQTISNDSQGRMSTVETETTNPLEWLQKYYENSEQRPGKAFRLEGDEYALIAAQPDFDEEWFESLDAEKISAITSDEETKLLETRKFYFNCGCSEEKLMGSLVAYKANPDELFQGEDTIEATCPRCNAKYSFNREIFDKFDQIEKKDNDNK